MPSKPLWKIPRPEDAIRQARAQQELLEHQRRDRADTAARRKALAREEAARLREAETRKRAEERRIWLETHRIPTKDELAALLDEFPNLKGKIAS